MFAIGLTKIGLGLGLGLVFAIGLMKIGVDADEYVKHVWGAWFK